MSKFFRVSPAALLAFALVFWLDGEGLLACAAPAAAVHELGHLLALWLCGARIEGLSLGLSGARLDYAGALSRAQTVLCALAGPLAGALYALAACRIGGAFWLRSGAASLCLTAFNLMPVLPLDGGRALLCLAGPRWSARVGEAAACLLALLGLCALLGGWGLTPFAAGIGLLVHARRVLIKN